MRFSESWLREWVDPKDVDTQTLVAQLTMAGLEVDALDPAAPAFAGVVVGLVETVESHPDAEKLRVCRVDTGREEPLQIVCGAANVAAGMKVPVAPVGVRLPGDLKIKCVKLRGVESLGMICSASELGLAESSSGIMPLPPEAPVGEDFRRWLGLDDHCIELDLTPDRGDCLSVAGIAREVGVINRSPLCAPAIEPVPAAIEDRFPVRLESPEVCPRYVCRIIHGIDPAVRSPVWLRERLRRSGLRSISPVVDVTNYVLLELGQPMHGFDLGRLDGEIRVRMARSGEHLGLLNGEEIALRDDTLVIADSTRPIALAGIMGGSASAVEEGTRDILLESAFFAPAVISGRARSYGLHTDSSHRFERGVDPELQVRAVERATALLLEIVGGRAGPVVEAVSAQHLPERQWLHLRRERIRRVLGLALGDTAVEDILRRLGMELEVTGDGWRALPPSSRFDLLLEVDLIAEIGRIHGYDSIPMTHASSAARTKASAEAILDLDGVRGLLVARGYQEAITYSFVSPELHGMIDPDSEPLRLANPISLDMSVMRTSLWPGLLQTARQNLARQESRVRIFETGLRFQPEGSSLRQETTLSGLAIGLVEPEQWGESRRPIDFYDIKADVEAILSQTRLADDAFRFVPAQHPALHPGQSARIEREGRAVGILGMLHPAAAARLDLDADAYLFEIYLQAIAQGALPAFEPISKFPSVRRDLALVIADEVPYRRVHDCIVAAEPELLKKAVLFDIYRGEKIDSGLKSLALGLIFQSSSQTLTDRDVEGAIGQVLARLEAELGARLRE
jgi:phenylalanyl-tRNA synthetase beta chain